MANLYQFPLDLASNAGEYPHRITFTALLSRNTSSTPVPGGMVALYLPPDALKTTYQQTYGDVDTGSLGMALQGQTGASAGRALAAMEGALSGEGGRDAFSHEAKQENIAKLMRKSFNLEQTDISTMTPDE